MFAIFCSIFLVFGVAGGVPDAALGHPLRESVHQVWQVGERRWTVEEEGRYAQWVEETVSEDFFLRYQIPVDCADVPYALRWIYARIAHLPAAATRWDGRLFGHWSTAWGHLPTHREWHRDRRFRAALQSVLSETNTGSLPADTYPIRIDRKSVQPGTVFFVAESHAGVVARIVLNGSTVDPVQAWEATLPPKIRKLSPRNFFATVPDASAGSGLVKFRWPVPHGDRWAYLPAREHPFFSEEQYGPGFMRAGESFDEAVAERIAPTPYDPGEKAEKVVHSLHRRLAERIPLVLEGYRRCREGGCPEGSPLWEVYSTPGRDEMIVFMVDHLRKLLANLVDQEGILREMKGITLPITRDQTVTLYEVFLNYHWLSPHPGDSVEARWGLRKCEMIRARLGELVRSLAFIERRYRDNDPGYADFARRRQFLILLDLHAEGEQAGCADLPSLPGSGENPVLGQ
jgi:hypothetical protein